MVWDSKRTERRERKGLLNVPKGWDLMSLKLVGNGESKTGVGIGIENEWVGCGIYRRKQERGLFLS